MRSRNFPDMALGLVFLALGVLILIQAQGIRSVPGLPVGPGLFPTLTGGAIAVFAVVLVVQSWFVSEDDVTLIPEGAEAADGSEPSGLFTPFVFGILGATLAALLVMPLIGFLATALLYTFTIVLLGGGRLRAALVFSPIVSLTIYALFAFGFRVPLPQGIWG